MEWYWIHAFHSCENSCRFAPLYKREWYIEVMSFVRQAKTKTIIQYVIDCSWYHGL